MGMGDKPEYFSTQATVAFIKQETFSYPACANPDGCNKKVMDNGNGWLCEKCDRTWPSPIHRYVSPTSRLEKTVIQTDMLLSRYILQMNVMDHTGHFWITAFNEVAEQLLGVSANDLQAYKEENNDSKFGKTFQDCLGKTFNFQMMAKQDSYNVCRFSTASLECQGR